MALVNLFRSLKLALALGAACALLPHQQALADNCSDFPGGVLDGFAGGIAPSQIFVDQNCTIRNFPAPGELRTNFSFLTQPGQNDQRWVIIFDNVNHTGQMACNAVAGHKIWFTNGSSTSIQEGCQNYLIPVEKIDKRNPTGQTTAAIGVPFTYTLTMPVLFDPGSQVVIDTQGSLNDLHSVTLTDDLNATGVALTYVSHEAYMQGSNVPVPHTFSNVGGLLTFDAFPVITAGDQIILEITVVLDDVPQNAPGTQFINTAKWNFGRLIDGEFFEPLPGEWGISEPLTIVAPEVIMTKTGPAAVNLGELVDFALDLNNIGNTDAWDVTIVDRMPDDAAAGMCDATPVIQSAQVFAADGSSTVPGKGPLVQGVDYTLVYSSAPTCELTLTMLTAAAAIGPSERLIIVYRTELDTDSEDGATLTNVAAATQWFDADNADPNRRAYDRALTNGTPGVLDHEDEHTIGTALTGYFFEKTVANVDSGANPTTTAAPGDTLRYTLRVRTTDSALTNFTIYDDLGALNALASFVPGTLQIDNATLPPGADPSNSNSSGGTNSSGLIDIRNLNLPPASEFAIAFEIQVAAGLIDGTPVSNQAELRSGATLIAPSDDPNANGIADPGLAGDEDPTTILIEGAPPAPLLKTATQSTATIGDEFSYVLTVPATPHTSPLYDVRIVDALGASAADLQFVSVAKLSPGGSWTPVNTGTGANLVIENSIAGGIDIPAGEQIVVEITVQLLDTGTNVAGLTFTNTAGFTYDLIDDNAASERIGEPGTSGPMTIVEPEMTLEKSGTATLNLGETGTFSLNVHNIGAARGYGLSIVDLLPDVAGGGMCDIAPNVVSVQLFEADGVTPIAPALASGADYSVAFSGAPACSLTITMLSQAASVGADERLIVTYEAALDSDSQQATPLVNVAGATQWLGTDPSQANDQSRAYTRVLTNGTPGFLDHEDAHTLAVALSGYFFEKSVENLTSGANPAVTAAPGDRLRYTLRLQTTNNPLTDLTLYDDLGALNATTVFEPGTLSLVTVPPSADGSNTNPNGGTNGAGVLDVRTLSVPADSEIIVQFEIDIAAAVGDGTMVVNQADLLSSGVSIAISDDPNVNGQSSPNIDGDEDPTRVLIEAAAPTAPLKTITQATAAIGERFTYIVTVPATPHTAPLYDVRILDDLGASAADIEFLGATKLSPGGSWTPVNTGSATNLILADTADGIDIPAGEQISVEIAVRLADTGTNVAGLSFSNTVAFTYNLLDGDATSERPGDAGVSEPMTVVEPELTLEKSGPSQMRTGLAGTFALNIHNPSQTTAWAVTLTDQLPNGAAGGMCDVPPAQFAAQVFEADGLTPVSPVLTEGVDYNVSFNGDPDCSFTLTVLTPAGAVAPGQRLIVSYQAMLDADSQQAATLTNVAGATEWFSIDVADPDNAAVARSYVRVLTDGTVNVLDHEDALTVAVQLPVLRFEKTVANVTTGENPGTVATPGDVLHYTLRVENLADAPLDDLAIVDELDALNATAAFAPGTLDIVALPAGADATASNDTGGASGTGMLDVRGLALSGLGDSLVIEFEAQLQPVLANASYVLNQASLSAAGIEIAVSDDPNVNGPADPNVFDDDDPTQIQIVSAPDFDVDKVSAYVSGDPNILLAGDTLRYTITVKNVGNDNASDTILRDQVPANTTYVPGSTTLNGLAVPDAAGAAPLIGGIEINAPEDTTPGSMRADASASADNVATIVFDVVVNANVIEGTIISNQGFVSAPDGGVADRPSDDPRTPVVDDPTRDVVGNLPLLFSVKSAALYLDGGSPGIVDPGDTLRYTIAVYNNGAVPATQVRLSDAVPNDTTYVADSLTLNGNPVGLPDGGVSPLIAGIDLGSPDLGLPSPNDGTISAGEAAIVQFDIRVNDLTPSGTLIVNQALVTSYESPDQLTDGDGNPATGPEPTVVVVGDAQQLSITKQVGVVGGGPAVPGAMLEYVVEVINIGAVPAQYVVLTDDLDVPVAGQLLFVDQSWTMNGSPVGITIDNSLLTADYSAQYGPLAPGASIELRFRATIYPTLPFGTTVTNTATVYWNSPQQSASASVSIDVGGMPGSAILNGTTWHDANFDNALDTSERILEGWTVQLYRNDQIIHTTLTDANGVYQIGGIPPNYLTQDRYELRFVAPGAGPNTALLGQAYSADFVNDLQRISEIVVASGDNLLNLDLPIDPNGVVYDSVQRTPVPGAVLTLMQSGSAAALPGVCFDDPAQQNQVTRGDGYYKFDLNFSDPACPTGASYVIGVTVPTVGYVAGYSQIIPPTSSATTLPFDVPACPGSLNDAIGATAEHCEAQPSEFEPSAGVGAQSPGTSYHVHLILSGSLLPGSGQVFNNHIPLDPELDSAISISKTTPVINVTRGQLVPYTITINNEIGFDLQDVTIVDRFPAGFRYIAGSARLDGNPLEPSINGRELAWGSLGLTGSGEHTIQLLLGIGAGVSEGEFVNRAQVINGPSGVALSGEASATVRLVPDPTFDCTDVMGKVFDDRNRNGFQDDGEEGVPGVRVVTARGLTATTDAYGRYHFTCAITPREGRGSNFVLKIDDRTLPSGFRTSTPPIQIQRATRGKTMRFNFGASIHRVIGLDLADPVFEVDSVEMRPLWKPRLITLIEELEKAPATLRLSYLADVEDPHLVDDRLNAVKKEVMAAWEALNCCYELEIEQEIFWRLGAPPEQALDARRSRR